MRTTGFLLLGLVACGDDVEPTTSAPQPRTLPFGPVSIEANSEDLSQCVALSIGNEETIYVNEVVLDTGPGFHHSNWLWVPEHVFPGADGVFNCDDRSYDQTAAGVLGGVFFAQSTQSTHEVQTFPPGIALALPPRAKLVAQLHLLNNGDEPLTLAPSIGFTPLAEADVRTKLQAAAFEYHPLGLPPRKQSRFTVECDIGTRHMEVFGRLPDFKFYYALAHFHEWGTRLAIDAVTPDGTVATIYSTENSVGDKLGGPVEPAFDMTGYTKLRLTCDYYNDTDRTIYYGNGGGEMCAFNAFSDSPFTWAGGALDTGSPGTPTDVDGVATFTRTCQVYFIENKL